MNKGKLEVVKQDMARVNILGISELKWTWMEEFNSDDHYIYSWATRRSNQSILKEINPEYSLERLMLKLKLQYFGHLMGKTDSFEKTLMLGKIEGRRRMSDRGWDGWMASLTQWTWVWVNSRSWWWTERPGMLPSMGLQRLGHDWVTELNWTVGKNPLEEMEQPLESTKESKTQYLGAISKVTEWSVLISKANHSILQWSESMPQPLML